MDNKTIGFGLRWRSNSVVTGTTYNGHGLIDDFRIYDKILTEDEISLFTQAYPDNYFEGALLDEQIKKLSKRINIKITKIGSITNKPNQIINTNGNYLKSIKNKGYLHKFK